MKRNIRIGIIGAVASLMALALAVQAENTSDPAKMQWPWWRGPFSNGMAIPTGKALTATPKVAWFSTEFTKRSGGSYTGNGSLQGGCQSPVMHNDKIYVSFYIGAKDPVVLDKLADGAVRLVVGLDAPTRFRLLIRKPGWCRETSLRVGDQPLDAPVEDGRIVLDREFRPGEQIDLHLAMDWRLVKGFRQQFGRAAAMRGPVVFSVDTSKLTGVENPRELVLRPGSCGELQTTDPMTCEAQGLAGGKPVTIPLQEFAVPTGTATYLFPADFAAVEEDELLDYQAIANDPDTRRVSGVIPDGLDVDVPGAEWDGTCRVLNKQWDGQ